MEPEHNPLVQFRLNDMPTSSISTMRDYAGHIRYPDKDITRKSPPCPEPPAPYNQLVFTNNVTSVEVGVDFVRGFYISDVIDRNVFGQDMTYRCKYRYRDDTWALIIHRQLHAVDIDRVAREFRAPNAADLDLDVQYPETHIFDDDEESYVRNVDIMTRIFAIPHYNGSEAISDSMMARIHGIMTSDPPTEPMFWDLGLCLDYWIRCIDFNQFNQQIVFNDDIFVEIVHKVSLTANLLNDDVNDPQNELWNILVGILNDFFQILVQHRPERFLLTNPNRFNGMNVVQLLYTNYDDRAISQVRSNNMNGIIENALLGHPERDAYIQAVAEAIAAPNM
jgi:hypothetical protein